MPIQNEKGLAALKALSEGGTAGLGSYKQAQANEAASRTTALQNALGGQGVADAAAKAQAQYAPAIKAQGIGVGDLGVAANSYLSRAANKLSAVQHEDQQNLTLQAESLRRKENELSAQERAAQLQGAADLMGQQQVGNLEADAGLGGQLGNLAARKAGLRDQLTAFDASNPDLLQGAQVTPELLAQRDQQRQEIINQMAGIDEQYNAAADQYAKFLGTDAEGFKGAYADADKGNVDTVRGLVEFLNPRAQEALGAGTRDVERSGQERLRDLAPAFGIDPLTAAGQFRDGEGDGLKLAGQRAKEEDYVAGKVPQAEADAERANALGFDSPKDYTALRTKSRMSDEEIVDGMQSEAWAGIQGVYEAAVVGDIPGGAAGFQQGVKDYVNGLQKPEGMDDATWKTKRTKLIQLANTYFKDPTKQAAGSDESEVE